MLYLVSTGSDFLVFTTREYLDAFLNWAILPDDYTVEEVEATAYFDLLANDTWHKLHGVLF